MNSTGKCILRDRTLRQCCRGKVTNTVQAADDSYIRYLSRLYILSSITTVLAAFDMSTGAYGKSLAPLLNILDLFPDVELGCRSHILYTSKTHPDTLDEHVSSGGRAIFLSEIMLMLAMMGLS